AMLTPQERDAIFSYIKRNRQDSIDAVNVRNFNQTKEVKKLVDFVRVERPYFKNRIQPSDIHQFFLVFRKMNSPRIIAQSGAFFISGLVFDMEGAQTRSIKIEKYLISKQCKSLMLKQLDNINVNQKTLFPGIVAAAEHIHKKYLDTTVALQRPV